VHPLCTALRTHNVLSHPPGVKPQRPSPEIKHNSLQTYNHSIHLQNRRTLTDIHITQNDMQEKLLLIILKWKMLVFTKVFLELSLALLSSTITIHIFSLQNEISKSLLPEGLIERFPPGLPTLINYIQWLSSPSFGSRSQPLHTLMVDLPNACTKARLPWLTSLSI
jgi:hypothetical protein